MRILFVDDDDIRTKPLREALTVLKGYHVEHIQTPHGAVEMFNKDPRRFKAVIVDIMLPHYEIPEYKEFAIAKYDITNNDGMYTGLEVLRQLRNIIHEKKVDVPLIVLTCIQDIEKYLNELKLNVSKILLKPIFLADFVREVSDVVSAQ